MDKVDKMGDALHQENTSLTWDWNGLFMCVKLRRMEIIEDTAKAEHE